MELGTLPAGKCETSKTRTKRKSNKIKYSTYNKKGVLVMALVTVSEKTWKRLRLLAGQKETTQKALVEQAVKKVFK